MTANPHYLSVLVGGFGVVTITSSRTYASAVSHVLYPTNMISSSDTASCTAPVSLSVWVLPTTPTPLTAAPLSLSVLVGGGGWFCYLGPLAHLRLCCPSVSIRPVVGGFVKGEA